MKKSIVFPFTALFVLAAGLAVYGCVQHPKKPVVAPVTVPVKPAIKPAVKPEAAVPAPKPRPRPPAVVQGAKPKPVLRKRPAAKRPPAVKSVPMPCGDLTAVECRPFLAGEQGTPAQVLAQATMLRAIR
jgi:hypothetical protein